ncbi:hypothetical protein Hanom_Chr14g01250121 [Helianthus anomalus]
MQCCGFRLCYEKIWFSHGSDFSLGSARVAIWFGSDNSSGHHWVKPGQCWLKSDLTRVNRRSFAVEIRPGKFYRREISIDRCTFKIFFIYCANRARPVKSLYISDLFTILAKFTKSYIYLVC